MANSSKRVPVHGSERQPLPDAVPSGQPAPDERMQVTVLLRRRVGSNLSALMTDLPASTVAYAAQDRQAFAASHGADPLDIGKVDAFARLHGIDVVEVNPAQRRMVLAGSVSAMQRAFGVTLQRFTSPRVSYRGRTGAVQVPQDLGDIIEGVFGLDDRPQAMPHFRIMQAEQTTLRARTVAASFTPVEIARIYGFPTTTSGNGQCVAIIELGGGFADDDLHTYFHDLGMTAPTVVAIGVDGAGNRPLNNPNSADSEVMLDIEVAGAVAPGAKIAVYFAPNTDAGFLDAVSTAIHDSVNAPSVVSISWGGPEFTWTQQAMRAMDSVFQDAAALGVTICCASGDDGSSDIRDPAQDDGLLHVDFPASSPFVLACGGTKLRHNGSRYDEKVWNELAGGGATGGGISTVFAPPKWQAKSRIPPSGNPGGKPGRGVPDVAGNADPETGYRVRVDGEQFVIGGTSAVAPLYAGLIALLNAQIGRSVGYLNPVLYALSPSASAFKDIVDGNNDMTGKGRPYRAHAGWDACTGLGRIDGTKLLAALQAH